MLGLDFTESRFDLDGTFGPVLEGGSRILADVDLRLSRYAGDLNGYTGLLSLTPKYAFSLNDWRFSLGVKLASTIYSDEYAFPEEGYRHRSGTIFPDVHIDYRLLEDHLILQTSVTGGDRFHSLSEVFFTHPFSSANRFGHGLERVRAMV